MTSLQLIRLAFWLVTASCWSVAGWVILDNQRKHRWYLYDKQLTEAWKDAQRRLPHGWVFYDGQGF